MIGCNGETLIVVEMVSTDEHIRYPTGGGQTNEKDSHENLEYLYRNGDTEENRSSVELETCNLDR